MRSSRIVLLITILFTFSLASLRVGHTSKLTSAELADKQLIASYHGFESNETTTDDDLPGGIKEDIPAKYLWRYQQWKKELLSTQEGPKWSWHGLVSEADTNDS